MSRFHRPCLLTLLLLALSAASGGVAPARTGQTGAAAARPIEQLGWLAGGVWTAEEPSDQGPPLVVHLVCHWSGTRNALLFQVTFLSEGRETPQYDGMYVWHPGKGRFVLWQVNRKGEVAEGELTVDGKEMDQTVRVAHLDGSAHFLKAHYTRIDDNAFRFKAQFRLSESAPWQEALDLVYKRQPGS
jgi:hypothetical protein